VLVKCVCVYIPCSKISEPRERIVLKLLLVYHCHEITANWAEICCERKGFLLSSPFQRCTYFPLQNRKRTNTQKRQPLQSKLLQQDDVNI